MENARTWHWERENVGGGWAGEGTTVHGCIRGLFPHQRNSMWCKSRCVPIGHFRVSVPGHPLIEPQQRRAKFTMRARNVTNKNPPLLSLSLSLFSLIPPESNARSWLLCFPSSLLLLIWWFVRSAELQPVVGSSNRQQTGPYYSAAAAVSTFHQYLLRDFVSLFHRPCLAPPSLLWLLSCRVPNIVLSATDLCACCVFLQLLACLISLAPRKTV
jgi:hypothetical protein